MVICPKPPPGKWQSRVPNKVNPTPELTRCCLLSWVTEIRALTQLGLRIHI